MPAFLAHFVVLDMAYYIASDEIKGYLVAEPTYHALPQTYHNPISQWAYLGSIGPDITGALKEASWVFEVMHWKQTNSFVANWMLAIEPLKPSESSMMNMSFLLGFLSHMAADTIVHPYVNQFAGVLDNQTIKKAASQPSTPVPIFSKPIDGIIEAVKRVNIHEADMHRFVELHQDAHNAIKYYGAHKLSGQAGDSGDASWSDFISVATDDSYRYLFNILMTRYEQAVESTYKKRISLSNLKEASTRVKNGALDKGYDWGVGFIPDKPMKILVEHPMRDRTYDDYLWAAAYTTVKYWEAAIEYFKSTYTLEDRKKFFSVVQNFNLDTGFVPRVYGNPRNIHIRYDHSWAVLLSDPKAYHG